LVRVAKLGLKVFYLRTREKRWSQQQVADALGVRQATLSHIEQGRSLPNCALLRALCEFFDVTPTFLLDDARSVVPRPTERWSARDALGTTGMWLLLPEGQALGSVGHATCCRIAPEARFADTDVDADRDCDASTREAEERLAECLARELAAHPRRRHLVARMRPAHGAAPEGGGLAAASPSG